jgi:pyroglutamyl-peptidase
MGARAPRILLTGFERFGPHKTNPTQSLAERLDGEWFGPARVVSRVVPVSIAKIAEALAAAVEETDPVAVVSLGLAAGETCVRVERVARNGLKFPYPDNDGKRPTGRIERGAPATRAANLPFAPIVKRLLAAGIPARLSDDAGLYLCNAALWHLAGLAGKRPFGFVHLPSTPEMVADSLRRGAEMPPEKCASMGLRLQLAAVRVVLAETARKALK